MIQRLPPPDHGWMHFVPFAVPEAMTVDAFQVYTAEQDAKVSCMSGTTANGEPVLLVGHDTGIASSRPSSKALMEAWHLERLNCDLRTRGGGPLYDTVLPTSQDPPDFVATLGGTPIAIEMTQLIDQDRRAQQGLFEGLKRRIEQSPRLFRAVRGCNVYVSYWAADDPARPFKVQDTANDEIIEAIAAHQPPLDALAVPTGPLPESAPDIGIVKLASGATVHTAPIAGTHVASTFMRATGFELVHATSSLHRIADLGQWLAAVVRGKDKPQNQLLVITAGGPTGDGVTWPSEEIRARHALNAYPGVAPIHLSRVLLHFWGSGETWDLVPEPRRLLEAADEPSTRRWHDRLVPEWAATSRNARCPCSSGKPFKRCHG